jgi:LmbE family N-acetylglucosaminyl deacetylase
MIKNIFRKYRQNLFKKTILKTKNSFKVTNKTTLIVAPHPDDETFGCTGLICEKKSIGSKVYVAFLTNGEGSLKNISKNEISKNRIETSTKVCQKLGVDDIYYLNIEDGQINSKDENSINLLKDIIENNQIEEVFSTHNSEGWKDHTEASYLVKNTLVKIDKKIDFYNYWVWYWFSVSIGNFKSSSLEDTYFLDISKYSNKKFELINMYLNNKSKNGIPYCGELPILFLNAFKKNIEVFEKIKG